MLTAGEATESGPVEPANAPDVLSAVRVRAGCAIGGCDVDEGLSTNEVGKEIREHARRHEAQATGRRDRRLVIVEAVVLSVVAVGGRVVRVRVGQVAHRIRPRSREGRRLAHEGSACVRPVADAARRRRDRLQRVVREPGPREMRGPPRWRSGASGRSTVSRSTRGLATRPFTNPTAPPGPQSMPQYRPSTGEAESARLDAAADRYFDKGEHAAEYADGYVRAALTLASVLFLIGINSHLPAWARRWALVGVGAGAARRSPSC